MLAPFHNEGEILGVSRTYTAHAIEFIIFDTKQQVDKESQTISSDYYANLMSMTYRWRQNFDRLGINLIGCFHRNAVQALLVINLLNPQKSAIAIATYRGLVSV